MKFVLSNTFQDSLARLSADGQKAAKTTAFDLQLNPAHPGLKFHRLDKARDKRFWSIRVSGDIRIIVHRDEDSFMLCYVDHHDKAYEWAEKRRVEAHPTTGALQIVEIREVVETIKTPFTAAEPKKKTLFGECTDQQLLSYGVPVDWLEEVRLWDEDELLEKAAHLPAEAAEALLELATGNQPVVRVFAAVPGDVGKTALPQEAFEHPDALRRFRVVADAEALKDALEYPWEQWILFLHPDQKNVVERSYDGPVRISGSAGTGKTVVALHRAYQLLRQQEDATVLLTTFSDPLANLLKDKLRRLILSNHEPRLMERARIESLDAMALRLYNMVFKRQPQIVEEEDLREKMQAVAAAEQLKFSLSFLLTEWKEVVDSWQIETWEGYRDVRRLGRKTRLPEVQRQKVWQAFERLRAELSASGCITMAQLYTQLAAHYQQVSSPVDHIVVDEAQDLSIAQMRLLISLGRQRRDALFFTGDIGQRIFQHVFSWKALGVDIRGRSRVLNINYRTSHQIRQMADRLLAPELSDVDGNSEDRSGTVSVFNGAAPEIRKCSSVEEEGRVVADWLQLRVADGVAPDEIGVFVRSEQEIERAKESMNLAGVPYTVLDQRLQTIENKASLGTMHLAKGMEFRAVVVMACDEDVIPSPERINLAADISDLNEVQETERHLLYVACTRARDMLLITSGARASEFIDDLG